MIKSIFKLAACVCLGFYFSTYALADVTTNTSANTSANTPLQCSLIVNKDPLWVNESVVINIVDFSTKQVIGTVSLPAATATKPSVNTVTQVYDCSHPIVQVEASYTPSVWSTDEGKVFSGKQIYNLTSYILAAPGKNVIKIEVTVNFPSDFLGVPALVD